MNKKLLKLIDKICEARCKFNDALKELQKTCTHEEVGECNYEPYRYFNDDPPMRVCLNCGMTETGWGCGYLVLKNERVYKLTRKEVQKERAGLQINDSHKGPLLRKEVTVQDLLEKM